MKMHLPWVTLTGTPDRPGLWGKVRCAVSMLVHEAVEVVAGSKRAHSMSAADHYRFEPVEAAVVAGEALAPEATGSFLAKGAPGSGFKSIYKSGLTQSEGLPFLDSIGVDRSHISDVSWTADSPMSSGVDLPTHVEKPNSTGLSTGQSLSPAQFSGSQLMTPGKPLNLEGPAGGPDAGPGYLS